MEEWREYVYFLRPVGERGPVKIGYSRLPEKRLSEYTKWSPVQLELAATIEGNGRLERQFHAAFYEHHSHHEWFHASDEIDAAINAINAGDFDAATLPVGRNLYGPKRNDIRSALCGLAHRMHNHVKASGERAPDDVWQAFRRTYVDRRRSEAQAVRDAAIVWRHLERVAPRPGSRTNRLMQRLLAEDAA